MWSWPSIWPLRPRGASGVLVILLLLEFGARIATAVRASSLLDTSSDFFDEDYRGAASIGRQERATPLQRRRALLGRRERYRPPSLLEASNHYSDGSRKARLVSRHGRALGRAVNLVTRHGFKCWEILTGKHTHTVILLHGLYGQGDDFADLPASMKDLGIQRDGVKFVFPEAPQRRMCWPDGPEEGVSAWYNYYSDNSGKMHDDDIDMEELNSVAKNLHSLIADEVAIVNDSSKVILGGNSQGGTVAAHAALTCSKPLGALLLLRSNVLEASDKAACSAVNCSTLVGMRIYSFRAELDDTFNPALTSTRLNSLQALGFAVGMHDEPGLHHEDDSGNEIRYAAKWLGSVFFGVDVNVTTTDADEDYDSDYDEDEATKQLKNHRALVKLRSSRHCTKSARCCGQCCVGATVRVTYTSGVHSTGGKLKGSYTGRIARFGNTTSGKILVEYDDPNATIRVWKVSKSTAKGHDTWSCDYSGVKSLGKLIKSGKSAKAGKSRWEISGYVQVNGTGCPWSQRWQELALIARAGRCCSFGHQSTGVSDRLLWVPGKYIRRRGGKHAHCPLVSMTSGMLGNSFCSKKGARAAGTTVAKQTKYRPFTDCWTSSDPEKPLRLVVPEVNQVCKINKAASKGGRRGGKGAKAQANVSKAEFGEAAVAASGNAAGVPPKPPLVQPKPKRPALQLRRPRRWQKRRRGSQQERQRKRPRRRPR